MKPNPRSIPWLALATGVAAVLTGCTTRDVAAVDPLVGAEQPMEVPVRINRDLDLIFVVDDSKSMEPNQESLVNNFPRFIELLQGAGGGLPNVHIGVLSTDVGARDGIDERCDTRGHDGRLIAGAQDSGCPGLNGQWLVDAVDPATGERIRNYDGDLADQFTCMASLGTDGCGFEQPLESLRRALEHPENQDFFREDALLGVIILADEDDCSVDDPAIFGPPETLEGELGPLDSFRCTDFGVVCDPVDCDEYPSDLRCEGARQNCVPRRDSPYMPPPEHFAEVLIEFKGDPNDILVATITGDTEPFAVVHEEINNTTHAVLAPSCDTLAGVADPAVRLNAFLDQFPASQTESTSICDGDLSGPIERIAARFAPVVTPCIGGQLHDTDPDQPGVQPECVIADVTNPGTDEEEERLLPECDADASNLPCWRMEESESCSTTPTGLALEVERGGASVPPNTTLRARCAAGG